MNIDRIKQIITPVIYNHIAKLDVDQLTTMRRELCNDMKLDIVRNDNSIFYPRQVELYFIDYRLGNNN